MYSHDCLLSPSCSSLSRIMCVLVKRNDSVIFMTKSSAFGRKWKQILSYYQQKYCILCLKYIIYFTEENIYSTSVKLISSQVNLLFSGKISSNYDHCTVGSKISLFSIIISQILLQYVNYDMI